MVGKWLQRDDHIKGVLPHLSVRLLLVLSCLQPSTTDAGFLARSRLPRPLLPQSRLKHELGFCREGPLGPLGLLPANRHPEPGGWCRLMPLWYNPLIKPTHPAHAALCLSLDPDAHESTQYVAKHRRTLLELGFRTVGDYVDRHEQLRADLSAARPLWPPAVPLTVRTDFTRLGVLRALDELSTAIPEAWQNAAHRHRLDNVDADQAELTALGHFGWPRHPAAPSLPDFTVASCTAALLAASPATAAKHAKWKQFYTLTNADPQVATAEMPQRLARLWKIPWCNHVKESYWYLFNNCLASTDRGTGDKRLDHGCGCCQCNSADRLHIVWDCPVAAALRRDIESQLQLPPGGLNRRHLLLMEAPALGPGRPALPQLIWDVVCLAAIDALIRTHKAGYSVWQQHRANPTKLATDSAIRLARTRFWHHLHDFCLTAPLSAAARERLLRAQGQHHGAHLHLVQVGADAKRTLSVRRL